MSITVKSLFVSNKCPYCSKPSLSSGRNLREHLRKYHTITAIDENQRRKDGGGVHFSKKRTASTEDVFGCCFCSKYFNQIDTLRMHIEQHIADSSRRANLRNGRYEVIDVQHDEAAIERNAMWIIDDLNITDNLSLLRKEIKRRNEELEQLTDVELLVLDHIYFFASEYKDSVPGFELNAHRRIIQDIPLMNQEKMKMESLVRWCSKIAEVQLPSWLSMKRITLSFLNEANQSEEHNQVIAAEIIHRLAPRLLQPESVHMLEDTFVHRYLDVILETIFGWEPRFRCAWVNGISFPSKVQYREEHNLDPCNEDGEEQEQESVTKLKASWILYANSGSALYAVGIMELKVDYKRSSNHMTNFVKLAKEMKRILLELIYLGVQAPLVCGILIEGDRYETFAMDLAYKDIYRMMRLAKATLCTSLREFGLFPVVFNDMMQFKAAYTEKG
ncbi:uncharacterized protein BYT42DRAFT_559379 [Radiomyces spectabilis]|uniref:uncharacterized protein n=1 Tax=Radiomyces spectabilis TaxID=64574 RepID=UPI00221F7658|nr:uncharacterized protein BYT42DRAFT_559379 [Radiomyces spectabilis]KAI8388227.1 hypothetical protein BYT42DRAFT_559379 [Radiomyces spectabilis]